MEGEFKNLDELYQRVLPALKTKVAELSATKEQISEEEIWYHLAETKWKDSKNLTLFDIVDDIIKFKITDLEKGK
jgi:hypothetical protein